MLILASLEKTLLQDGSLLLPAQVGSKNLAPLYDKVNLKKKKKNLPL
jgi:hypothetical protein